MTVEFKPWAKTPRLYRDITITEKIDGTNAAIHVAEAPYGIGADEPTTSGIVVNDGSYKLYEVVAQSRKRIITLDSDNYGFARWVWDNAETLVRDLGPGTHFGEWWGQGIQRRYGLDHKRFSLFNTHKWANRVFETPNVSAVPVLYQGSFSEDAIQSALVGLACDGSKAAPGFYDPEGVVVYHSASAQVFKILLENDDIPKGLVAQ